MKVICHIFRMIRASKIAYLTLQLTLVTTSFSWSQQNQTPRSHQLVPFNLYSNYTSSLFSSTNITRSLRQNSIDVLEYHRQNISVSQLDALPSRETLNSFFQDYSGHTTTCLNGLRRKNYRDYLNERINRSAYNFGLNGALSFIDWLQQQPTIQPILTRLQELRSAQWPERRPAEIQHQEYLLLTEVHNILNRSESVAVNCDSESSLYYQPENLLSSMEQEGYQGFFDAVTITHINGLNVARGIAGLTGPLFKPSCRSRSEPNPETADNNQPVLPNYTWSTLHPSYFVKIQSTSNEGLIAKIIYFDNRKSFYFQFDLSDLIAGHQNQFSNSNDPNQEIVASYLHPENQRLKHLMNRSSEEILSEEEFNAQEEARLNTQRRDILNSTDCSGIDQSLIDSLETHPELTARTRVERNTIYTISKNNHPFLHLQQDLSERIRRAARQVVRQITSIEPRRTARLTDSTSYCREIPTMILQNPRTHRFLNQISSEIATWYKNRISPMLIRKLRAALRDSRPWIPRIQEACLASPGDPYSCRISTIDYMFSRQFATESECEPNIQLIGFIDPRRSGFSSSPYESLSCIDATNQASHPISILTDIHSYETDEDTSDPASSIVHFEACQTIDEPELSFDQQNDLINPPIEYCMNSTNLSHHLQPRQRLDENPDNSFFDLVSVIKVHILQGQRGFPGFCMNRR